MAHCSRINGQLRKKQEHKIGWGPRKPEGWPISLCSMLVIGPPTKVQKCSMGGFGNNLQFEFCKGARKAESCSLVSEFDVNSVGEAGGDAVGFSSY